MFVLPVPREYVAQNSKLRIAIVYRRVCGTKFKTPNCHCVQTTTHSTHSLDYR